MDKKLYKRICDIYAGATGNQPNEEDTLYADQIGTFITALFNAFAMGDNKYIRYFSLWNIKEFAPPKTATEQIETILLWNPELLEKKNDIQK